MCNRDECVTTQPVPHSDTAPVRVGVAATILNAWLIYYNRVIDPISSSVWGWSATNDVPTSNHLSGTALDINAPKYPWGTRTMPQTRIAKVRRALDDFAGSIFWGADWDYADEMHFQLAWPEGDKRNDQFAARLEAGYLNIYTSGTGDIGMGLNDNEEHELLTGARQLNRPWSRKDVAYVPGGDNWVAAAVTVTADEVTKRLPHRVDSTLLGGAVADVLKDDTVLGWATSAAAYAYETRELIRQLDAKIDRVLAMNIPITVAKNS